MKNKYISFILAFCMFTAPLPVFAEKTAEPDYAQVFYDGSANINIAASEFIEPASPVYTERDGVQAVKLHDGSSVYAAVNIKDGLFRADTESSYAITVRYFDEGSGFAVIRYSSASKTALETSERLTLENSGEWKEHTFYIDNCVFRNAEGNRQDFLFARYSQKYGNSKTPMYVQWIKIEECFPKNPLDVTVTSDYVGNIFDVDDEKVLRVNAESKYSSPMRGTLNYRVTDFDGNLMDEGGSIPVDFEALGAGTYEIRPNVTRCGTYSLELTWNFKGEFKGKQFESSSDMIPYDFSIGNKIKPNEPANRMLKTNYKAGEGWGDIEITTKLIRELGISGVRDEYRWHRIETSKGVYALPNSKFGRDWINPAFENTGDIMFVLIFGNGIYGMKNMKTGEFTGMNIMPDDELFPGSVQAFCNYVEWVCKEFRGKIKYFEVWNEPDNAPFNTNGTSPEKYTELLKAVYPVIKKNAPEAEVVGFAGLTAPINWVRRSLATGAIDYIDAASFHPYDWDGKFDGVTYKKYIQDFKNLMAEYGKPDIPIYLTEMGIRDYEEGGIWPNGNVAAAQTVEYYAISQAEKMGDLVYQFAVVNNYPDILWENGTGEQRWGLVMHENERVPYAARPGAISTMAYNTLIGNAEPVKIYTDNETYIYQFKRESDGKDVIIYWTEYGGKTLGLNLGAERAEYYDIYSNNEGTLHAVNGVFTVTSSFEPTYLVGNFSEFELTEPTIETNGGRFTATYNDPVIIKYSDKEKRSLRTEITHDDNLTLTENNGIADGTGRIVLTTGDKFSHEEAATVKLYDGEDIVYIGRYHILEAKVPLTFTAWSERFSENSGSRFTLNVTVSNNTQGLIFTGEVAADLTYVGGGRQTRHLVDLKPGMSATLRYNLPVSHAKSSMEVSIECTDSSGMINIAPTAVRVVPDLNCAYADTPPPIHGAYSAKDWQGGDWFKADDAFAASKYKDWGGKNDASFEGTVLWDEENMYLLIEATDDQFYNVYEGDQSWQGDSFQIGIKNELLAGMFGTDFTEIGIYHSMDGKDKLYRYTSQFSSMGPAGYIDCDVCIEEQGGKWIYRAAIPWETVVGDQRAEEGSVIRMAFLCNDNDGAGRQYVEFNTGIATTKTPAGFSRFILTKNK